MTGINMEKLKESFDQQYGIEADQIKLLKANRLYIVKIQEQRYALKVFTQQAHLEWQSGCLEQLEHRNTAGIIPFLRNAQASFINQIEGSSYKFGLQPFVQGSALDPEIFPDLKNCIALLGHIHTQSQHIQGGRQILAPYSVWAEKWLNRYVSFSESVQTLELTKEQKKYEDGLISLLLSFEREAVTWAEWFLNHLPGSSLLFLEREAQLKRQVVHLDVAAHNFLVSGLDSYYLLDYDLMQYSPVVLDVAQYIHRSLLHYHWSWDVVWELLSEYEKQHQLQQKERDLLPMLLAYPHDIFREWLGVWKQQAGFQVQGIMGLFQKIEASWQERRKFVRACQAMVK